MLPLAIIAGVVLVFFVARSWTHGLLRPVVSILALGAGYLVGYWAWHAARTFLTFLHFAPENLTTFAAGILAGAAAFLVLRGLGHAILAGLFAPESLLAKCLSGPLGALLSLIPAAIALAALATAIRVQGTYDELRFINRSVTLFTDAHAVAAETGRPWQKPDYPRPSPTVAWRNTVESTVPDVAKFLDQYDPVSPIFQRNLAGLILISKNTRLFARLGDSRRIYNLFEVTQVEATLRNPDILRLRDESRLLDLARQPDLVAASSLPGVQSELSQVNPVELTQTIIQNP